MNKFLIFFLVIILTVIVCPLLVLVSPIYFTYKLIDRILTHKEVKNGHHEQPKNPLLSFLVPFAKDFINPNKKTV